MDAELLDILGLTPGTATLEAQVIGCLMAHGKDGLKKIDLEDTDFSDPANQEIFRVMSTIVEDGGDPESCAVRDRVPHLQGKLGIALQAVPTGQNLIWHVQELKKDIFRRMEAKEKAWAAEQIKAGADHESIWGGATANIEAFKARYVGKPQEPEFAQAVNQIMLQIREQKTPEGILKTTVPFIDRMTHGLAGGENCILAARPGVGKTDLALNIAVGLAMKGTKTTLFSIEMMAQQLAERITAMISGEDCTRAIRDPKSLSPVDRNRILGSHAAVSGIASVMDVHTRMEPTIAEISRLARKSKEAGSRLLIVDYLQLMSGHGRSRNDELEIISREWKGLLKELGIPGIMLSQMSRQGERENRKPKNSDLRDSGSIEQDADLIWFLHREERKSGPERLMFLQTKGRQVSRGCREITHTGSGHWLREVELERGEP